VRSGHVHDGVRGANLNARRGSDRRLYHRRHPLNGPQITVVGHLAWAPRARVVAGGTAVADFRIATTPRKFDKATNSWTDLETLWFGVTCWRGLAENATQSLKKGDRVVVTGRLTTKSWKNEQGEDRSSLEIDATSVGIDLSRGPVTQTRVERTQVTAEDAPPPSEDEWPAPQDVVDPVTAAIPDQVAA
jgi:single-strand DNA-binding protein